MSIECKSDNLYSIEVMGTNIITEINAKRLYTYNTKWI